MDRLDDIRLPETTPWLRDDDAQRLCRAIRRDGGHIYFVGGCVRDALLGRGGADVDFATDLLPPEVTRLGENAGLKVVPTGIDHGTVTIVSGGKGFEVTTFRRDVKTDGRRAVVSFSTDIAEDARRRDFTLNALYATPEGEVIDPLGGVGDCLNRRIRFIEDADLRIREDYLRILRFFRFHAWYARPEDGFDSDALDAVSRNSAGLGSLSAERVGAEVLKLLTAPDPAPAVATMRHTGCLHQILPGADDMLLGAVVDVEKSIESTPDRILRLAALGGEDAARRLRLDRADRRRLALLTKGGYGPAPLAELAYRHGRDDARAVACLRAALVAQPVRDDDLDAIETAARAVFPIKAKDLMPAFQGKALGERLDHLERRWIASGFTLSREDLTTTE